MPIEIHDLEDFVEETYEEYKRWESNFGTHALRSMVSDLSFKVRHERVATEVEDYLDRHLDREELEEVATRFDDRKKPPCYTAFVLEVLRDELHVDKPNPRELGDDVLYCFDRDATVETGIPRGPVPLSTVEKLAEDNVVYATGNQHLRKEAGIPGVTDLHDGFLPRKQGISRVWQEECEDVDAAVAIDDMDVSDVADLDFYYEPWEFYFLRSKNEEGVTR